MPSWDDFAVWIMLQAGQVGGRKSLQRRWANLRALASQVAEKIPASEIQALLGKSFEELDPENNDLKALVAYAVGLGMVNNRSQLQAVLQADYRADPLYFLAQHSGKTFGEKFAPMIAKFWLSEIGEKWEKQPPSGLYDISWLPQDHSESEIRIELKASSEYPSFRFQQIRHPRLSGSEGLDYDLLLCLGVSAGSLEWWAIPGKDLDQFVDSGKVAAQSVIITRHHGKRRPIWNETYGYADEGWFCADSKARKLLDMYYCADSQRLRSMILSIS